MTTSTSSALRQRVAVAGASGRMGRMLIEAILSSSDCVLAAALDRADSRALARSIRQRGKVDTIYAGSIDEVPQILAGLVQAGDIVVTQGAGNVGSLAGMLADVQLIGGEHGE